MGRNYKRKTRAWTLDNMKSAIESVKSGSSLRSAALRFQISRRTIQRYMSEDDLRIRNRISKKARSEDLKPKRIKMKESMSFDPAEQEDTELMNIEDSEVELDDVSADTDTEIKIEYESPPASPLIRPFLQMIHNVEEPIPPVPSVDPLSICTSTKHTCLDCSSRFHTKALLTRHMKTCSSILTPCPDCPLLFPTSAKLTSHQLKEHPVYKCDSCSSPFKSRTELITHQNDVCFKQCSVCECKFPSDRQLKSHLRTVHDQHNWVQCSKCPKTFKTGAAYRKHAKVVHTERSYVCQICGKGFKREICLSSHLPTHDPVKAFKCDVEGCEKEYSSRTALGTHRKVKHTAFVKNTYLCDECGFKTIYKASLQHHMILHTGKQHSEFCDRCGNFFTKRYIKRHLKRGCGKK